MNVLVTGIPNSIHLARWISAALGSSHRFHILPSVEWLPFHPELEAAAKRSRGQLRLLSPVPGVPTQWAQIALDGVLPKAWRSVWFEQALRLVKPDLVHALELQHAGYAWLDILPASMPFCVTSYGSDLSLFPGFERHTVQIRRLLERADFLTADCARDLKIAHALGFAGVTWDPVLDGAGVDVVAQQAHRKDPPSSRRTIAVRGYAGWSGRALMALDALLPIKELASRFEIVVYSCSEAVRLHAQVLRRDHGLAISTLQHAPREAILKLLGSARVTLAVSISDGASTALLEAMAAGSLPVHSTSACADEFIVDGASALLVDPHRIASVTAALERGLTDDALVDAAAELNWQTSNELLDEDIQARRIRAVYDEMACVIMKRREEVRCFVQR